jgi:MFS family permease
VRTVRQWVHETAGGLPRQFWYVWCTTLINRLGSFVVIVLAIYLTGERGLSAAFAGLVIGLWGAGGAVGTMVGGVLADRWGRKPTVLTFMGGGAAMMIVLGLMRAPVAIAVAALLLGAAMEGIRPAISALLVDLVPEKDRPRAFSLNYWVLNVAFAFAATAGGFLASIDIGLLFFLDAATTAAAAIFFALKVHEPARERPAVHSTSTAPDGLSAVLRDRVFLGFVALNMLVALVFLQHISTLPMSMTRDGLSPATFGSVIALNGVLIVVGQLFLIRVLKKSDHTVALAVGYAIMGVGFGITTFAATTWLYALTVLVWTLGEMLQAPSGATTMAALSPAHLRGRYQGLLSFSWSIAAFVAPLLGGAVLQYGGKAALWLGCLGICLLAAVLTVASRASRERRAAQLSAPVAARAVAVAGPSGAQAPAPA